MKSLFAVIGLVIIVGLAAYLLTNSDSVAQTHEFTLRVESRTLVEGEKVLSVRKGDTITFRIVADEKEEFHLHGYDRSVDLAPGETATLTFVADVAGRFPAELELSKIELITLEVLP